jgi:hypothetical protein
MPVGPYETFADCVSAQRKKGKDGESAKKICGAMERDSAEAKIDVRSAFSSWESCMSTISQKYDEETAKKICGSLRGEGQAKIVGQQATTTTAAANDTKDHFYVRAFLIDPSLNINKWAVTEESIPRHINTFIGKPLVLTDNYDHPGAELESLNHWLEYQKSFKVGEIIDIVPRKNPDTGSTAYHAVIEITNDDVKADIRNNSLPLYVSPAIAQPVDAHMASMEGDLISEWTGIHLAIVDQPAFGIKRAVISDTCAGNKEGCLLQLRKAHVNTYGLSKCGFCIKGALKEYHQRIASRAGQLSTSHSQNWSAYTKKSMSELERVDSTDTVNSNNNSKPIEKIEKPFSPPTNKQPINPPPSNTPSNIRDLLNENQKLLHELELRELKIQELSEAHATVQERIAALELRDRRKDIERIITPDIIKDDKARLEKIKSLVGGNIPISEIEELYKDMKIIIKKANVTGNKGARVPYGVTSNLSGVTSNLSATNINTSSNLVDEETGLTSLQKQLAVLRGGI